MRQAARASLNALTGTRFFAAFWVVAYHFTIEFQRAPLPGKPASGVLAPPKLGLVLMRGHLAVDFFFLLSGFILAYTYATPGGKLRGSAREFWVARIARIYPVYLLGLAMALPEYLKVEPNRAIFAISGVAHLTMLHAWLPFTLDWNQPSWSLSVEAFFYLLFPFVLPLAGRLRRKGLWRLLLAGWIWFVATDAALVLIDFTGLIRGPGWNSFERYSPLASFPEFIAGMALGLLFVRYGADALPLLRRLSAPHFDGLIVVALLGFGVVLEVTSKLGVYGSGVDVLAPLALPALTAIIFLLAFQRGLVARFLSLPLLVWLGEISYAIYILHKPIWFLLGAPLWQALDGASLATIGLIPDNLVFFAAFAALVILVSGLSFAFLERPLRRAIRQRWGQPRPLGPLETPTLPRRAISLSGDQAR